MRKRLLSTTITPFISSALVVLGAFAVGAVFLVVVGKDPLTAYQLLVSRGIGSSFGVTETLIKMAPLLIVSAGLLIALKASVWNIGIDGQFLLGAALVGIAAPTLASSVPLIPMLVLSCVVGFIGGALWGIIPALLKVRYGLNEIITTIMMNYVAIYLTSWMVKGPFKDPKTVPPQTTPIPLDFRFPHIPLTEVHVGLLVGLAAVVIVALLFSNTTIGFKLSVLGQNQRAAIHAGWPVGRLTVLAMLLSAGFAGLAGANDVLAVKGMFQGEWNPGYGLIGFALVFLARLNSVWVIPFAYFFSFLLLGGEIMARSAGIPVYFVQILEGLMLIFFAASIYVEHTYSERAHRRLPAQEGG
ncbi:MAG: ABC transporter permease [Chloroflexota bacterium]